MLKSKMRHNPFAAVLYTHFLGVANNLTKQN